MIYVFARYISGTKQWIWQVDVDRWSSILSYASQFNECGLEDYIIGDKCLLPLETAKALAKGAING